MPEKKKQHFVPKLHLRQFSNDFEKKRINVYLPDSKKFIRSCPLESQAQGDYFYGKDKVLEDYLGKLEDNIAPIIQAVINKEVLPEYNTHESFALFYFTIFMAFRTKFAAEKTNELLNKTIHEIAKFDQRLKAVSEKGLIFRHENPAAFNLAIADGLIHKAYDLSSVLLINNAKNKFITSDNPSVKYNQFLEKRRHPGGHLGLSAKGLQIFFPVSPRHMIVYYDKWAYKFGNRKDIVVYTKQTEDVDQLNLLQLINCTQTCYSSGGLSEVYLNVLGKKAIKYRGKEKVRITEVNKRWVDEKDQTHILYQQHGLEQKTKLELSFVKEPKHAKSHILNDYVVQVRHEHMREGL